MAALLHYQDPSVSTEIPAQQIYTVIRQNINHVWPFSSELLPATDPSEVFQCCDEV